MSKNITIPLSAPSIGGNAWKYVKDCLDTGWVSSVGSYVERFEASVRDYVGSKYAVATVNGTSALHLALLASGVAADDEVIVPTLTFIATVNAVCYCQAHPVFMDCSMNGLGIDTQKVADFLKQNCVIKKGVTYNRKTNRRVKAVMPVHIFGHPADMNALMTAARKYNLVVIEDATESIGSLYRGQQTGVIGDIGCFSFNGNKIITTGGGGMVVTANAKHAQRIRHLSTQARTHAVEYDHDAVGYNYRLTNLQAALGVSQMEQLDRFIKVKRKNAQIYQNSLGSLSSVRFLWEEPWAKSNFWFYTISVPARDKNPLIQYLIARNISVRPVWKLNHAFAMFKNFENYAIENAVKVYATCINVPCSIDLKTGEIERVCGTIKDYFKKRRS